MKCSVLEMGWIISSPHPRFKNNNNHFQTSRFISVLKVTFVWLISEQIRINYGYGKYIRHSHCLLQPGSSRDLTASFGAMVKLYL
jgi:hypothetical protein